MMYKTNFQTSFTVPIFEKSLLAKHSSSVSSMHSRGVDAELEGGSDRLIDCVSSKVGGLRDVGLQFTPLHSPVWTMC